MYAFVEVIALLFGMSGFGIHNNPHPPTPDQVLEYGVADADVAAYIDAASLIPGNYEVLTHLAEQPEVRSSPEVAQAVKELVSQIEAPRTMMKAMTGIDPVHDIYDAAMFVHAVPHRSADVIVAVRGRFTPQLLDKIAALRGGSPIQAGDASYVRLDDDHALAITHDGVLLAGATGLVTARLAHDWHPPVHHADTTLGYLGEEIAQHAVFAVVITPGKDARRDVLAALPPQGLAHDLAARARMVRFAVFHDGIGWSWLDRDRRGLQDMTEMSEGLVDLLHAAQVAPAGFIKIALGALDSYRGDKELAPLLRMKPQLERLIAELASDGPFKAQVTPNPGTLRLDVRLTGKHVGFMLPAVLLAPAAGFVFFMREESPMQMPVPASTNVAAPAPMIRR